MYWAARVVTNQIAGDIRLTTEFRIPYGNANISFPKKTASSKISLDVASKRVKQKYTANLRQDRNVTELTQAEPDWWLQRLRADEPQRSSAIEQLRSYLVRGLTRALSHRYGGQVQVEDVAQLALIRILDSLDTFEFRSRFETWAMSIAIRIGISELRKRYYRDVSLESMHVDERVFIEVVDTAAANPEQQNQRLHLFTLLQQSIDSSLSDKQRLAVRGSLAGLPIEEIASRLNSNRNAIYKLLHDARLRLRQALEAHGVTAEDISTLIS